jgi:hypothetical protein
MEAIAARIAGTKGRRCCKRLDAACAMTTPEREPRDWLLELDAAVHRDQDIVVAARPAQEIAILDAGPAASDHGLNVVAGELEGEITGRCSSRRTRTGQEGVAGQVECGDGLFALHGRKLVEKLVESIATFQMIEERLHRDPRAQKDRGATEDVWIALDDLVQPHHVDLPTASLEMLSS